MAVMIGPSDPDDARRLAIRLLEAAGPEEHDEVRTVWDERAGVAFLVPPEVAGRVFGVDLGCDAFGRREPAVEVRFSAEADGAVQVGKPPGAGAAGGSQRRRAPRRSGRVTRAGASGEGSAPDAGS